MKRLRYILLFSFLYCLGFSQADSSEFIPQYRRGMMYHVKTTMGTAYLGFLAEETKDYITLENRKDKQFYELKKSEITVIRPISDRNVFDETVGINYHAGIYLFSASSIVFEDKPEISINYQWFLFDNVSFSLHKNWDVTVNSIFLYYPTSIGIKCAYQVGKDIYLGGNVFVGGMSDRSAHNFLLAGGALARITKGTSNNNFSFSGGMLGIYSDAIRGRNPFLNIPFASFAYCNRFSEKWGISIESFYFPQSQSGLAGCGFKFLKNKESAWSFGCYTYLSTVNNQLSFSRHAIPIPFVNYSTNRFRSK
jgi:hypothetical protein